MPRRNPGRTIHGALLFVGYRRSAVAAMRWSDVDLDRRTWSVPGASAKNELIVLPLAGGAFDAIQRRAQERARRNSSRRGCSLAAVSLAISAGRSMHGPPC